ncbi:DUF234 domain-containing protein [Sulfurimonas sp. HSL3-2]|uniref:DUF234 domain-containing protein n=1 Tax=Hydrocurvibacter mobilis TaxID=3131936 RepID=UPI0031F933D5
MFGGSDIKIDVKKPVYELIVEHILTNYNFLHKQVSHHVDVEYSAVLTGLALGDGRIHSAFKRARISDENAGEIAKKLMDTNIVRLLKSRKQFTSWVDDERVSDKLLFTTPFMRFWFAFVAPIFKGIKEGNYDEFNQRYENKIAEFREAVFKELSNELVKISFAEEKVVETGAYWDREVELDIFAKTASKKVIVGTCRYTNSKLKKSEIAKLEELANRAKIKADVFVIVAKRGFSSELKSLKSEDIRLFTLKSFKSLL